MVLHARVSWMANQLKCQTCVQIIPHVMHAVRSGIQRIVALSGDTDVFVLHRHYWGILHSEGLKELWVRAGVGDTRYIPVDILAPRIGQELSSLLPLVHTLTGCDYTSEAETKYAALNANPSKYLILDRVVLMILQHLVRHTWFKC